MGAARADGSGPAPEGAGWTAVHLDAVEAVGWRGTELRWHPLRAALGSRIVGMAAYTADRAGQEVVEDHVETRDGRGHDEVYVVLRGTAAFQLDGEEVDAPAGTFLAVAPHVRRHAVAVEAGTAVLALGGPADYEPAGSEWVEQARPHMRDRPLRARAILDDMRRERPDSLGLCFGEALLAAAQGDEAAREPLLAPHLSDMERP